MAFCGAEAAEDTPWEMDAGVRRGEGGLGDSLSKGRNKQSVSWEQEGGLQRVDDPGICCGCWTLGNCCGVFVGGGSGSFLGFLGFLAEE